MDEDRASTSRARTPLERLLAVHPEAVLDRHLRQPLAHQLQEPLAEASAATRFVAQLEGVAALLARPASPDW